MRQLPQPRSRIPIGLIAAAALALCLLLGGIAFAFWREWQIFSASAPAAAWTIRFLFFAIPVSLLAGYGWAGLLWIGARIKIYLRRNEHQYIAMEHATQQTLAQRSQGLPASITSLNYHDSHREERPQIAGPIIEGEVIHTPPIPTFAQLLDSGAIGQGKPLILGYNAATGMAISGSWKDLYSCGIGAQQGAGKTWLLAFLLAQSAAAGGRLIVCDLHAGDDESLANRIGALAPAFMCDIASTPKEIESAFAFADDKLEKRKGSTARWPIVIVADEWTSLLRTSAGAGLPGHIQNIAEQGRKFNVNGMLAAQAWTKDASSAVRNQLTSHYVLRQRPDEARYQLGLRSANLPDDIRSLPDATAYLLNVKGELIKVIIPTMTPADIARCGEMIASPASARATFGFTAPTQALSPITASAVTSGQHSGDIKVTSPAQVTTASQSPEAARALALLHDGKDLPAIVAELRSVRPKEGRRYMTALSEVTDLIRQATKGVQG